MSSRSSQQHRRPRRRHHWLGQRPMAQCSSTHLQHPETARPSVRAAGRLLARRATICQLLAAAAARRGSTHCCRPAMVGTVQQTIPRCRQLATGAAARPLQGSPPARQRPATARRQPWLGTPPIRRVGKRPTSQAVGRAELQAAAAAAEAAVVRSAAAPKRPALCGATRSCSLAWTNRRRPCNRPEAPSSRCRSAAGRTPAPLQPRPWRGLLQGGWDQAAISSPPALQGRAAAATQGRAGCRRARRLAGLSWHLLRVTCYHHGRRGGLCPGWLSARTSSHMRASGQGKLSRRPHASWTWPRPQRRHATAAAMMCLPWWRSHSTASAAAGPGRQSRHSRRLPRYGRVPPTALMLPQRQLLQRLRRLRASSRCGRAPLTARMLLQRRPLQQRQHWRAAAAAAAGPARPQMASAVSAARAAAPPTCRGSRLTASSSQRGHLNGGCRTTMGTPAPCPSPCGSLKVSVGGCKGRALGLPAAYCASCPVFCNKVLPGMPRINFPSPVPAIPAVAGVVQHGRAQHAPPPPPPAQRSAPPGEAAAQSSRRSAAPVASVANGRGIALAGSTSGGSACSVPAPLHRGAASTPLLTQPSYHRRSGSGCSQASVEGGTTAPAPAPALVFRPTEQHWLAHSLSSWPEGFVAPAPHQPFIPLYVRPIQPSPFMMRMHAAPARPPWAQQQLQAQQRLNGAEPAADAFWQLHRRNSSSSLSGWQQHAEAAQQHKPRVAARGAAASDGGGSSHLSMPPPFSPAVSARSAPASAAASPTPSRALPSGMPSSIPPPPLPVAPAVDLQVSRTSAHPEQLLQAPDYSSDSLSFLFVHCLPQPSSPSRSPPLCRCLSLQRMDPTWSASCGQPRRRCCRRPAACRTSRW